MSQPKLAGLVGLAFVAITSSGAAAQPWRSHESAGDTIARRAAELYRDAFDTNARVFAMRRASEDDAVARRALRSRAEIAVAMLDAGRFRSVDLDEAVRATLGAPSIIEGVEKLGKKDLRQLIKLLNSARTAYARLPNHETRDLALLYEVLGLTQRLLADAEQKRADAEYQSALAKVTTSTSEGAAAGIRLRFKLRQFSQARLFAKQHDASIEKLGAKSKIETFARLRAIAEFSGDRAALASLGRKIRDLGGRAEQPPRTLSRFPSPALGARADLAKMATDLVGVLSSCRLSQHDRALVSFFAALPALDLGEFGLAVELLRPLVGQKLDDAWLRAGIDARLATARDRLGDYESAIHGFEKAWRSVESLTGGETFRARLTLASASSLAALGRNREASERARTLLRQSGLPQGLRVRARVVLGGVAYARAKAGERTFDDVLAIFNAAERELAAMRGRPGNDSGSVELERQISVHVANILRERARRSTGAHAQKLRDEAIARQDVVMRAASKDGDHVLAAVSAANLGELYLESGRLHAAEKFIDWALAQAKKDRQLETEWRCHWYRARLAAARGEDSEADGHYDLAAQLVDSYRARLVGAESKRGYMSDKLDLFRDMARREIARSSPERALEIAERARARALVESLGWRHVVFASETQSELYREFISLVGREARGRRQARRSSLGLSVKSRPIDYDAIRNQLEVLRARILTNREKHPALAALVDGAAASSGEIARLVARDTTLIEYFSLGDRLAAFVVEDGRVRVVSLDVHPEAVARDGEAFFASRASDVEISQRLFKTLIAPLEGEISKSRLVIVPCSELRRFPFEALQGPDGLLGERFAVSYLPAASVLRYLHASGERPAKRAKGRTLLALADPNTDYDGDGKSDKVALANATVEVQSFAPRFLDPVVLEGAAARESTLRDLVAGRDVIHFACHGEFYPASPWESTLFLAPDREQRGGAIDRDGRLRAHEIYGLDLRGSELVVLSGCETAQTQASIADDPVGLGVAFLHSGAPTLIASLWRVEDRATSELMRRFYAQWLDRGLDRVAALRVAKTELRQGGFGHPRQWAAFVLVGNR